MYCILIYYQYPAHKINGPKGIGFLYAEEHVKMNPLHLAGNKKGKDVQEQKIFRQYCWLSKKQ